MLMHTTPLPSTLPEPDMLQARFSAMERPQRVRISKAVQKAISYQGIRHSMVLEWWYEAGLTDAINANTICVSMLKYTRWDRIACTCRHLRLNPSVMLEFGNDKSGLLAIAKATESPLHQLTFISNAWRPFIRPWFKDIKQQRLEPEQRQLISKRWLAAGLVSSEAVGKVAQAPSSNVVWNIEMVKIALRTLNLKPEPTAERLLAMVEAMEATESDPKPTPPN